MSKPLVDTQYLPHVSDVRHVLASGPHVTTLLDEKVDPALLEGFLIQLCALGVYMTEPVDGWIRRAGEACTKVAGLEEVGRQLISHAKHEAGHHLMMVEDTKSLVAGWNKRRMPKLDAEQLLAQAPTPAMQEYRQIHEETINSAMPGAQVAIEYEIENLSVVFAPRLIEQCKRVLGDDVMNSLTFIKEHVELDVGHTALNEVMLNKLLGQKPEHADTIGKTGARALDIYLRFYGDCMEKAKRMLQAAAA
ncbi:iron-containing redox enzyme family protein [Corallococcus sp. ZKHCc1 1396]|uniref:Iron-containing redox enzyme family protein n=1 Tax=Corallococcus soli TaxID=2710757 RepID=A0ABR9PYH9_9BACT|nr:iron-containing redox enzyme family protein [Corallococcus soli]MBE4752988.1 iron-containing redox enzyme family protein [Corallococcus soli]